MVVVSDRRRALAAVDDATPPGPAFEIELLEALRAVRRGDFSVRLATQAPGLAGDLAQAFNDIVELNHRSELELRRIRRIVGQAGRIRERLPIAGLEGDWARQIRSVNQLIDDVTTPASEVTRVLDAVARGDLGKKLAIEVEGRPLRGELRRTAEIVNPMVDQLNAFAGEVTRVAREVGTEGKLGGQADVKGVAGTWKDLTDNVNSMAANLTTQVRNIAEVVTAVANGDLRQKIAFKAAGEIAELAGTINSMTDTLATFAEQVTTVAREVGSEGQLGGQARVPGAAGTWRDLTDNVNLLADNLTTQVRALGEVATAVTRGDLSRTVQVEAAGEVELLKDNVNEMIRKLRDTTRENIEQDWLKTNVARFARLLQGQRDLVTVGRLVLSELAPLVGVQHGVFYLVEGDANGATSFKVLATYAAPDDIDGAMAARGLVGQAARDGRRIVLSAVPGNYISISTGLGAAEPGSIVVLPIVVDGRARAILELASFEAFSEIQLSLLDQLAETVGPVLNSIEAAIRGEQLLGEQAARVEAEAGLARLRQVVDVMPEGILIADAQGTVYLRNAAAEEIMGLVPTTVIPGAEDSAPPYKYLDGSPCDPASTPLARAVLGGEVVLGEQLVVTNTVSGRDVPILVNSAPLSDGAGYPAGGVAVFQDITPLRDLERQKDEFLAAVSHDLKTPATIILGRASLLQRAVAREKAPSPDFVDGLQSIEESTNQLVRLVNELLDVTRLRMGQRIELDLGPADLVRIVRRLATEYQNMSPRHEIRLETELNRLLGDWDEARIERIVSNLLSNSVKYSPHGGAIRVNVEREERGEGDWAVLTVQDWGLGIPPQEQARVFEPYYRGTNVAHSTSGTGVGLAGTRHIVEQHGGEIGVKSVEGDSTIFTVRLPLIIDRSDLIDE